MYVILFYNDLLEHKFSGQTSTLVKVLLLVFQTPAFIAKSKGLITQ